MRLLRIAIATFVMLFVGVAVAHEQRSTTVFQPTLSIDLWPRRPPGDNVSTQHERVSASGSVSHVSEPRMDVYRPSQPNGTAVLIIAGGGYESIGIGKEALPSAQWLASQGITAVILYYRLPKDGWRPVAPFQDAQRAMRLLRADASKLGINPQRVGVLGFSAGGNLAGITATRFNEAFYPPIDDADRQSSRPNFASLIYPVISLQPPFNTTQSSRQLSAQPDAANAYSVELHVSHETPPTFLAQAADDPIANIGNSLVMFDALHRQNVPAELHVFQNGGHGWGLGKPGTLVSAWPQLFLDWVRSNGFLSTVESNSAIVLPNFTPASD